WVARSRYTKDSPSCRTGRVWACSSTRRWRPRILTSRLPGISLCSRTAEPRIIRRESYQRRAVREEKDRRDPGELGYAFVGRDEQPFILRFVGAVQQPERDGQQEKLEHQPRQVRRREFADERQRDSRHHHVRREAENRGIEQDDRGWHRGSEHLVQGH